MSSAADTEERIPAPKQRVKRFWCKVLGCQLIFDEESDRDHHSQLHSEQESEKKRKQKAERYQKNKASTDEHESGADMETQDVRSYGPAAGIETMTGDVVKHGPAQVDVKWSSSQVIVIRLSGESQRKVFIL